MRSENARLLTCSVMELELEPRSHTHRLHDLLVRPATRRLSSQTSVPTLTRPSLPEDMIDFAVGGAAIGPHVMSRPRF